MNKAEYAQYLKSDHWKELRGKKMARKDRRRCGVCADPIKPTCHHLSYRKIYDVETSDLRRMCWRCHSLAHDLMKSGALKVTSNSHHGRWSQTKVAVKKALGLTGKNLFTPRSGVNEPVRPSTDSQGPRTLPFSEKGSAGEVSATRGEVHSVA